MPDPQGTRPKTTRHWHATGFRWQDLLRSSLELRVLDLHPHLPRARLAPAFQMAEAGGTSALAIASGHISSSLTNSGIPPRSHRSFVQRASPGAAQPDQRGDISGAEHERVPCEQMVRTMCERVEIYANVQRLWLRLCLMTSRAG